MTYQQPHPPTLTPTPPIPPESRSAGFAVASLVLGIVGVVLSFVPILNTLTAAGAIVGLVLGVIGVWRSTKVMASIGAGLCVVAVVLTVVAQNRLVDELDEIGASDITSPSTTVSTTLPRPQVEPAKYTPSASDWGLDVVVTEQQCFGSAGCNVSLHVELTYLSGLEADDTVSYELVYDVLGTEDSLRGTTTITGDQYTRNEHFVSTTAPDVKLTAKVVSFERIG